MIPLYKLERLPAGQRRRKLALLLASVERDLLSRRRPGGSVLTPFDPSFLHGLVKLALLDEKIDKTLFSDIQSLLDASGAGGRNDTDLFLRLCNHARHGLLAVIGTFPAEWDLVISDPDETDPVKADVSANGRPYHAGVMVFAEDIRSPFNIGSIFRTAEAFGAERLFASPLCVAPTHPRALRSAMGCVEYLPWERTSLENLPPELPVFALETGGTPLGEFDFPERGIVIVGSEELGISPEGLAKAAYGRVSIPMTGIKASLNVGVAFGILMESWTSYLSCSSSKPF